MSQCRLIKTQSGESLHLRYWSGTQWRRSGATVASGTIGVVREEQSTPVTLDTGVTVPGFVRMEWPDLTQANKVSEGWIASNFTTIVNCPGQLLSQTQKESPLYFDPATDPHDRPLTSKTSFLPMLAFLTVGYFLLFK
jgi:hypothetical protein